MSNAQPNSAAVQVEGDKNDWITRRIMLHAPELALSNRQRFEYNKFYSFWRADYGGQLRRMIRDYELLKARLPLPTNYSLAICGSHLSIRENQRDQDPCGYDKLIAAVPMDSPVEPEDIWSMIQVRCETLTSRSGYSFGNLAKSHVLRSTDFEGLVTLRLMLDEGLGHQGYMTSMFIRNGEKQPEMMVALTHSSESLEKFADAAITSGFKPFDSESAEVRNAHAMALDGRLAQEEVSLLQHLEAVRARRAVVKASLLAIGD